MGIENIGIKNDIDGHDWNHAFWKWQQPSFRFYYRINKNHRGNLSRTIKKLQTKTKKRVKK